MRVAVWCVRSDCGRVPGLLVLITDDSDAFPREEMGIQKTWLWDNSPLRWWCCSGRRLSAMVSLERSTSPAFVSMCFHGLGIACCRASLWRSDLANPYQASADLKWIPTCVPDPIPSLCLRSISSFDGWLNATRGVALLCAESLNHNNNNMVGCLCRGAS